MSKCSYVFACSCGCGQVSDKLEKDYQRLPQGKKWYAKDCEKEGEKKEFKGGYLVKEDEF